MIRTALPTFAFVVLAAGVLGLTALPMSLGTDVGLTDATVCDSVTTNGERAINRLTETGFPHASTSSREVYRMTARDDVQAMLLIDWNEQTATCLPLDNTTPYTASLDLTPAAYDALTTEIRNVLDTGDAPASSWADRWNLFWGMNIDIPENQAYETNYELKVRQWAAGHMSEARRV